MFILDSLFLSGFRWVLNTVVTAAEAEMNDDTALRERLLEAELRREMGEISDEEFVELEADVLARIREIKERREGGSGPLGFAGQPLETSPDSQFAIEATVSGDFHDEPAAVPFAAEPVTAGERSGTVIEGTLVEGSDTVTPRRPAGKTRASVAPARRSRTAPATATSRRARTGRRARAHGSSRKIR
jgi:Gas vesicle protein G